MPTAKRQPYLVEKRGAGAGPMHVCWFLVRSPRFLCCETKCRRAANTSGIYYQRASAINDVTAGSPMGPPVPIQAASLGQQKAKVEEHGSAEALKQKVAVKLFASSCRATCWRVSIHRSGKYRRLSVAPPRRGKEPAAGRRMEVRPLAPGRRPRQSMRGKPQS